jgi:hypothetical protein
MAEPRLSVLDFEARLAFRRRTQDGWVPGLPRRKRKSEYSEYGEDGESLSVLLAGIDAIKEPFANRRDNKHFLITMMPVREQVDALMNRLGASLWPGETGKTPAFIDPSFKFDYSIEEHRERYEDLLGGFERQLTFTALRYCSISWYWRKLFGTVKISQGNPPNILRLPKLWLTIAGLRTIKPSISHTRQGTRVRTRLSTILLLRILQKGQAKEPEARQKNEACT